MPILADVGIQFAGEPEIFEVHNTIRRWTVGRWGAAVRGAPVRQTAAGAEARQAGSHAAMARPISGPESSWM